MRRKSFRRRALNDPPDCDLHLIKAKEWVFTKHTEAMVDSHKTERIAFAKDDAYNGVVNL